MGQVLLWSGQEKYSELKRKFPAQEGHCSPIICLSQARAITKISSYLVIIKIQQAGRESNSWGFLLVQFFVSSYESRWGLAL